jgi:hypothetical protein
MRSNSIPIHNSFSALFTELPGIGWPVSDG